MTEKVEIVRCKNCKYCKTIYDYPHDKEENEPIDCLRLHVVFLMREESFCCYGEEKEEKE